MKSETFVTREVWPFSSFAPFVNPGSVPASLSPGTYADIRRSFVGVGHAGSPHIFWFHSPISSTMPAFLIDGVLVSTFVNMLWVITILRYAANSAAVRLFIHMPGMFTIGQGPGP